MLPSLLLIVALQTAPPATQPTTGPTTLPVPHDAIGTAVYAGGELLMDYDPEPAVNLAESRIERAKFPVVDVHCHWSLRQAPEALLAAMEAHNIAYAVNLSGGWGDRLDATLERFDPQTYPRLITFCNLDWSRVGTDDWDQHVRTSLADAKRRGAKGLKIAKNLGLTATDAEGELIAIDDERLDVVWETCGELGLPILQHVADPVAFFEPVDETNERWLQLKRRPGWSFYGEQYPDRDEVLAQFDRVVQKHPETTWIAAHLGNYAEDLAALGQRLETYPNLYADISAREAEWGRVPYTAREFFIRWQDRLLFGTDRYPGRTDQPRYRVYFRILETRDEYFDYYEGDFPPTGEWKVYGLHLPDEVLRKLYYENAASLLALPALP